MEDGYGDFDFTPLYHSTVGFDRPSNLLSHALDRDESGYPAYNIEKTGEDAYRIAIALAGFSKDDLRSSPRTTALRSAAVLRTRAITPTCTMVSRSARSSACSILPTISSSPARHGERPFGLELKRELPEALKPRTIEIGGAKPGQIEAKAVDKAA